ncbi:MAG TPA: dolichol kinase, partial [Bacteroidota bacterium]|nr:dolichol kinase [Bacteroidota bacterium]
VIPILYLGTTKTVALSILIPLTVVFFIIDVTRYYFPPLGTIFYKIFGTLLRKHESDSHQKTLNGATYVLIAASLSVALFPKIIAVTAFTILIISDMTSALVGKRFGRHKFFGKSFEGSSAFFLSAVVVVFVTPKIAYIPGEYAIGFFSAAIGALIEALPIGVDDNITIPLCVGSIMWVAYNLFYPAMNLYQLG